MKVFFKFISINLILIIFTIIGGYIRIRKIAKKTSVSQDEIIKIIKNEFFRFHEKLFNKSMMKQSITLCIPNKLVSIAFFDCNEFDLCEHVHSEYYDISLYKIILKNDGIKIMYKLSDKKGRKLAKSKTKISINGSSISHKRKSYGSKNVKITDDCISTSEITDRDIFWNTEIEVETKVKKIGNVIKFKFRVPFNEKFNINSISRETYWRICSGGGFFRYGFLIVMCISITYMILGTIFESIKYMLLYVIVLNFIIYRLSENLTFKLFKAIINIDNEGMELH
ncbi:hypothetical protein [uncultured Clostridium sp.]|uniref:hypothetical protein n=1 Tax=uncultured Clostridium sp. TaxID=59620 RepID=UPI0025EDDFB6|nr:hypothetical protein [uncultured Clostridium sp.]